LANIEELQKRHKEARLKAEEEKHSKLFERMMNFKSKNQSVNKMNQEIYEWLDAENEVLTEGN